MVQKVKIILLGRDNVGKTSLVSRLVYGRIPSRTETTLGVAFKSYRLNKGTVDIDLNIWDTAGQERFSHFLPLYIHHAKIAFICFELPDIRQIQKYIDMIKEIDTEIIIFLIATKIDLYGIPVDDRYELIHPKVEKFAEDRGLEVIYTSSKTGQNVLEAFERAVDSLEEKSLLIDFDPPPVNLNRSENYQNHQRCC